MKKILIIDDDTKNIFALSAVLKSKGYQWLSAISTKEGFEILSKEDNIGVVLMDMMMPEMGGYEAIGKILENEILKNILVIAVTAQAMAGDRERSLEAGAMGYISKPINLNELVQLLNGLI